MGKVFGALSLALALLGIFVGWLLAWVLPWGHIYLPIAAIILGIIGIIVDDSKGMAIAGLVIGSILLVIWLIFGTLLIGLILLIFEVLTSI